MGKSLKPQLKWDWLVPDSSMSLYEEHAWRIAMAISLSFIPFVFSVFALAAGDLLFGIPFLLVSTLILVGWGVFGYKWPELHWLHDMTREQVSALEWYDELTEDEKAQLPSGWDALVREQGDKTAPNSESDPYYSHYNTVAYHMESAARTVISLYHEANKVPEVPDYRIATYKQLMTERAEDLQREIKDRKEIEKKIKEMT